MADPSDRMPERRLDLPTYTMTAETIVQDENNKKVHVFNRTSRFVWDRCDGITSRTQVLDDAVECFTGVTRAQFEADMAEILAAFQKAGLLNNCD